MKRLALILCLLLALNAEARIGGGDSYSGSSDSSSSYDSGSSSYGSSDDDSYSSSSGSSSRGGGGGGDDGAAVAVMMLFFFGIFVVGAAARGMGGSSDTILTISAAPAATTVVRSADMSALLRFDPNFSEIVFRDFCYSLYARLHDARGRERLAELAPYVSAPVREGLQRDSEGMRNVDHIVIGSFTVTDLRGLETARIEADVEFEANYTENDRRFYVREEWTLERARDILSPAPEKARAVHCPKCGAPLQTRTGGACLHCGSVITDGSFQWFVRSIAVREKHQRPPRLGGFGEEVGTDRPTVYQPWFARQWERFSVKHPGFSWQGFEQRVRHVAEELQVAWTKREWQHARPFETDALFQMHRYWIDEYLRQGLRNIVEDFAISSVEAVKVTSDAFYDAITVRIFASGRDFTLDDDGNLKGGSSQQTRLWSEYWTFIRGRAGTAADAKVCPNCGGPLGEGQTAICGYCGGKIVTGEFPWVLSRIEQDEAYRG